MYEITVKRTFSAAHTLSIEGVPETLHGHNFTVEVTVSSADLDDDGLVTDFRKIKRRLDDILKDLDHSYLNDLQAFRDVNPSAERLARHIFDQISVRMGEEPSCRVQSVTVWESENARAAYRGAS